MNQKEQKKWEEMISLTTDHETVNMLQQLEYNWEVASSRMEQIAKEREQGLFDDSGVEVMAVFNRLERVGTLIFALKDRPQAVLLRGFRELLAKMNADRRMDAEVAAMISPAIVKDMRIDAPTIWKRIQEIYENLAESVESDSSMVRSIFKDRYLPNMDYEESLGWMMQFVKPVPEDEEKLEAQKEAIESLVFLGENIGKVAANTKQQMALGIIMIQQAVSIIGKAIDMRQMDNEIVDAIFEEAKHELMKSDDWRKYWRDHVGHLSLMGNEQLSERLKADAEEVEQQLLDLHGYLYNKWDESEDAFGQALKESDMSDEEMLRLLFLLAKKEMLEKEGKLPDNRLPIMRKNVCELAEKVGTLCSDKYIDHYEKIWEDIVQNPIIGAQLAQFRNSGHNQGFNMQCFCHIIGWLMRAKQFFDTDSPTELGNKLGDKYNKETLKDYIKKTKIMLTAQSISELEAILERYEKK